MDSPRHFDCPDRPPDRVNIVLVGDPNLSKGLVALPPEIGHQERLEAVQRPDDIERLLRELRKHPLEEFERACQV